MKQHRKKQSAPNTSEADIFIIIQYIVDGLYWVAGFIAVGLLLQYATNFIKNFIVNLTK